MNTYKFCNNWPSRFSDFRSFLLGKPAQREDYVLTQAHYSFYADNIGPHIFRIQIRPWNPALVDDLSFNFSRLRAVNIKILSNRMVDFGQSVSQSVSPSVPVRLSHSVSSSPSVPVRPSTSPSICQSDGL